MGTAQYVSPEVLRGESVEQACDYWALGVIVYQFLTGNFLFDDVSEYLIYRKVLEARYKLPDDFHELARDLIQKFVVVDVKQRLGSTYCGGVEEVKRHSFFAGMDFEKLATRQPPL